MSTRRPRYRYIAFRVDGPRPFTREEMLDAVRGLPERPWLVDFDGHEGLVRATNLTKEAVVRAMAGLDRIGGESVHVSTLGTSGTIRRARAKYLA